MLSFCRRNGVVKIFLICLVLTGAFSPFSADANKKQHRSSYKSAHKAAHKAANKGLRASNRLHSAKATTKHKKQVNALYSHKRHGKRVPLGVDSSAAYSDLVMDARTGRILHATRPDELRHPASLTKMMTLYLAFEALKSGHLRLDQYLPVSQHAADQEPSKLGLRAGQQIRVEDALLGLVTKSANDATMVVAEALGGSEEQFARMMTNKARALGMKQTVFRNPSGLPNPEQVTTAREMAILGYALVYHHPKFYPYFSRGGFTYAGVRHNNHNHLMSRYRGMDGIKTGYIRASGFNLVASTVRGPTRLIGVVFGGRSAVARDNKMAELLDHSFAQLQQSRNVHRASVDENDEMQLAANVVATEQTEDLVAVPAEIPEILPTQQAYVVTSGQL
ncbi:MAG: D-alanyl-D-alanine carboxypeptidase [Magnetococcus sp. YQC-3]